MKTCLFSISQLIYLRFKHERLHAATITQTQISFAPCCESDFISSSSADWSYKPHFEFVYKYNRGGRKASLVLLILDPQISFLNLESGSGELTSDLAVLDIFIPDCYSFSSAVSETLP